MLSALALSVLALSGPGNAAEAITASTAPTKTAVQIALLLPQSGRMAKAAESIRNGFLAAYYQDTSRASDSPSLRLYDSDSADINTLVKMAQADGASIIVGPLDRMRVQQLIKNGPASVPVLTLNQAEGRSDNLFQFALAPEDEIQRVVEWLTLQKIRQPLILTSSEDTGQRLQKLFQSAWQLRHNTTLAVVTLDATRKGGITAAIHEVTLHAGKHDALFLASPGLARQVQPALTYYHSPLPLYSLASAWDPTADASGQRDLDGLRFCDQPWMLASAQTEPRAEQDALYDAFPRPSGGYDRLYAFGADAWTLVTHWQAVQDGEALALRSGVLRADALGHLRRTPTCAEVSNGIATAIWSPDSKTTAAGAAERSGR